MTTETLAQPAVCTTHKPTVTEFLRTLFALVPPDQFLEYRGIHHTTKEVAQEFFTADAVEEIAVASHKRADEYDNYFGVCPRIRPQGRKRDVTHAVALWADMDWKRFPDGEAGALRKLAEFPLPPSWVIGTGGGFHVYWQLDRAVKADAGFEGRLRKIVHALQADPAAVDRSRVLRMPGSFNFKYQPEPQVRILQWPTR